MSFLPIGLGLMLVFGLASAVDVHTYIPTKAPTYLPVVKQEVIRIMPETPSLGYFGALIEQESCISLTHKRCWDPSSELKTSRELGIGLGQLTVAYRTDGRVRFDTLKEMRDRNSKELKDLSWLTIRTRPDLQIRTMVLMIKSSYGRLQGVKDPLARLSMADAAYNGGDGGLARERTVCGMTKGCDPQQWFGHVEAIKVKSQKPLYGDRSAWDINREHAENDMHIRLPKYEYYFLSSGASP